MNGTEGSIYTLMDDKHTTTHEVSTQLKSNFKKFNIGNKIKLKKYNRYKVPVVVDSQIHFASKRVSRRA